VVNQRTPTIPARRGYADVPWGQAHVTIAGSGPAVVFLHSIPRSSAEFRDVITHLPGRTAYAIDLPGFGASDPLPGPASIQQFAAAMWAICEQLGIAETALVGHHGGGVIGLEMAAGRPDRVASLVLSSTPWLGPRERDERRSTGIYYGFEPQDDLSHLTHMADRRRRWMPVGRPEFWNGLIADVLRAHDPEAPLGALMNYVMEERIALVRCPTLVVGRRGDIWFDQRSTFAAHLAHPYTYDMDGSVLVEDTAPEFVGAVSAFLDDVSAGVHPRR
jgi:pimeloyl-ACP methyl ester carboxylesterase